MSHAAQKRSHLLVGCGSAALALGLLFGPDPAAAQGIQASGNVVFGSATIEASSPNDTLVEIGSPTAVIDWTPAEDALGNALTFLPAGSTATFNSLQLPDFAILNRILPSTNGNIAEINGAVISRVAGAAAPLPGGFVAFYSPTGILIGSTATFDVGRLLLTTLDTTNESFDLFAQQGGFLSLAGAPGSTARIAIAPGAQITATPENAFFAVVAADVEMRGIARINGSHAYVAGEVVNLSFSNGLFNISVPVGTAAAGEVVTLDGTVGGPSSTGVAGDNHMIYAVARASADPISMLFRGNLGFDPAQAAGVVNGEIILSANYDVFGRFVDGGTISDGVNAQFGANSAQSPVRADIALADVTASSSLLAIGTHAVAAGTASAASSFAGNLLLVGRESATLTASGGNSLSVTGDVLVDSRDYGVSGSFLQQIDVVNAAGGNALIEASGGSTMTLGGEARVLADALAGVDTFDLIGGSARGGTAAISGNGGTIGIAGGAVVSARGVGSSFSGLATGAEARGGVADLRARAGGTVTVGGSLTVIASAVAGQGSLLSPSSVSDAFGGTARIALLDGGGTITVDGLARLDAGAIAGAANAAGAGSIGDAGEATIFVQQTGEVRLAGALELDATGVGGANAGGTGGTGLGGRASVFVPGGGAVRIAGDISALANGTGGAGLDGGAGFGGISGANVAVGLIAIGGLANVSAGGEGGAASFGFGGTGGLGRGGNAFLQADGTLAQTATLTVAGDAFVNARGRGGSGGSSDGQAIAAGSGGTAFGGQFTVPNQADPAFTSGAFVLAGGDNGNIAITGGTFLSASAEGGNGGNGLGPFEGGQGGDAFGGLAQVGLALLGQDGSVGLGTARFTDVSASAEGIAGNGGISGDGLATGIGGDGTGGNAFMTVRAGEITANDVALQAFGLGGAGGVAGGGTGGAAAVFGSLGGTLAVGRLTAGASGAGGFSDLGTGGAGLGGSAGIIGDGIAVAIATDALVEAGGRGGSSTDGAGGDGTGGEAYITTTATGAPGTISVTGHAAIYADGEGGNTVTAFAAGNGTGGLAYAEAFGGSTIGLGSLQAVAVGRGGLADVHEGGDGTGGTIRLGAAGTGSSLSVARNVSALEASESPGGTAFLNANGFGAPSAGGSGIGGTGRGGTVNITAAQGGRIDLPVDILADPDRAEDTLLILARGFGGDSSFDGGTGGAGFGGTVSLLVDGGTLVSGPATPSAFAQGGNAVNAIGNVTGGNATGGTRAIRVINGGSLTIETQGGGAGAQGGAGAGTGNGGNATGGAVLFEVIDSVANLLGSFNLFNSALGGAGERGGNAGGGAITVTATNAQINLSTGVGGAGVLAVGGDMIGGAGVTAGGDAQGTTVDMTLTGSTVSGGGLDLAHVALGGAATGAGGNATGAAVRLTASGSTLNLSGPLAVTGLAIGGDGGAAGTGGTGTGGEAAMTLTDTTLALGPDAQGLPGSIAVRADGSGGLGGTVGGGVGGTASFSATGGAITTGPLLVSAQGTALGGQTGGAATGGQALAFLGGAATLDATTMTVIASATSGPGGSASGGTASFSVATASTATVNAADLLLFADASGGDPLANTAGRFSASAGGGNVNLVTLSASANGDLLPTSAQPSELAADGGNLNVTGDLTASTFGDLLVRHGGGGIIGGAVPGQTTTNVLLDARGTLRILGDGGATGGLGGQTLDLIAGRSILVDGTVSSANGSVALTANAGGGQVAAQPPVSVIAMGQGARIDAGTGAVAVSLLDGAGDPQRINGAITLAQISAGSISARNFGTSAGSDINLRADSVLTASGTGRAIDLAALNGEVVNLAGDAGLVLTGGGHFGIFAATPTGSQIGSFANYARRYNVATAAAYDTLDPGGNFAAFRIAPVLSVTANDLTVFYGTANPALTASFTGFLPGDGVGDLTGAPQLTTPATATSGVGTFAINAALGTLLSEQGYQFTFAPGILTIAPRPLTLTADNLVKLLGDPDPALTFTVSGQGLVNGDVLTGNLVRDQGETIGIFGIRQGTLSAGPNYDVTFVGGVLRIIGFPTPPELNNPVVFEPPLLIGDDPPPIQSEEDERFGIDFPERPEAPLISEDPLLDDPVASGSDTSLYGGSTVPPAGDR